MVSEKQLVADCDFCGNIYLGCLGSLSCRADLCLHLHASSLLGHASEQNLVATVTKQEPVVVGSISRRAIFFTWDLIAFDLNSDGTLQCCYAKDFEIRSSHSCQF